MAVVVIVVMVVLVVVVAVAVVLDNRPVGPGAVLLLLSLLQQPAALEIWGEGGGARGSRRERRFVIMFHPR